VRRELSQAWIVAAVLLAVAVVFILLRTDTQLQPEIKSAFVAIQPANADLARTGRVEIEAGVGFRLFAVVEASDWRDRPVYYTEAESLEIAGQRVAEDRIRSWNRRERASVLWFTVEGSPPYLEISTGEDLERPRYREIFQGDWPHTWAVAGGVAPAVENFLPGSEGDQKPAIRFGTQRFHVRIELFGSGSDLLPTVRLRSAGASDLEAMPNDFPTIVATLPSPLVTVSRVFGLPQTEATESASAEVRQMIADRSRRGLSFSRLPLFREWLGSVGLKWDDLLWRKVEVGSGSPWSGSGALIRAGSKVAFTYEDRGFEGRLDHPDLCLDFDRGATVRTLGELFVGEGFVELASAASTLQE